MDNARIDFLRNAINAREFDGFVVAGLLQALRELAALNRYHAVETDTKPDDDDPEILPCPFCGSVPRGVRWGKVKCEDPRCLVRPSIRSWYVDGFEAEAIAEWNTRAPITTIAAVTYPPGTTLTRDTLPLDFVECRLLSIDGMVEAVPPAYAAYIARLPLDFDDGPAPMEDA